MTTSVVSAGYVHASRRTYDERLCDHSITATHTAHPTCSDGIAAYWLLSPSIPRGALAAAPHQPYSLNTAIVSANPAPSSSRGGAVGSSQKPTRPIAVAASRELRPDRYAAR